MKLKRDESGSVTLGSVPIREWFQSHGIRPVQSEYRGFRDGHGTMCLLTAMSYDALGDDAEALHARTTYFHRLLPHEEPDPNYKKLSCVLADLLGITGREARDLEAGWCEDRLTRAVAEARTQSTELWELGFAAWEQAKGVTFPPVTAFDRPHDQPSDQPNLGSERT